MGLLEGIPPFQRLYRQRDEARAERDRARLERDQARAELEALRAVSGAQFVPPGHFYSPIPDPAAVRAQADRLFGPPPRALPGIDLREAEQRALLRALEPFYDEQPFPAHRTEGRRFWFENPSYSYSDALFLYGMIRHARPRRVIEIGSGHSSCVTLDTNELFFENRIEVTFIEPYPELLRSLLGPADAARVRIVQSEAQVVDPALFQQLEANDILFIDSTHVSKVGSDVNHLLFHVLPALRPGVYVHVHDIIYPFEYPSDWFDQGRAWNEAYALRSFLAFNSAFEIVLFNTFLEHFHRAYFERRMPLCLRNTGGSLWIRRRG